MATFKYNAKTESGQEINGTITAKDKKAALFEISKLGYYPMDVASCSRFQKEYWRFLFRKREVKKSDLAAFYQQFADLIDGGVTVSYALGILKEQQNRPPLNIVVQNLISDIQNGLSLSEAMRQSKGLIPELDSNIISAGEASGNLELSLNRLANLKEREHELKSKIHSALAYPILLLFSSFLVIIGFMIFVVPSLVILFEESGQKLPLITKVIITVSNFIVEYGWMIILPFIIAVVLKRPRKVFQVIKNQLAKISLHFPIIKKIVIKSEIASFADTLESLLRNGITILSSWDMAGNVIQNVVLRKSIKSIKEAIIQGEKIGFCLQKNKYVPRAFSSIVSVGEESNRLEEGLAKAAKTYRKQVDVDIKLLTTLLEPAMILVIGLLVGFIIISMLLPIFQLEMGSI